MPDYRLKGVSDTPPVLPGELQTGFQNGCQDRVVYGRKIASRAYVGSCAVSMFQGSPPLKTQFLAAGRHGKGDLSLCQTIASVVAGDSARLLVSSLPLKQTIIRSSCSRSDLPIIGTAVRKPYIQLKATEVHRPCFQEVAVDTKRRSLSPAGAPACRIPTLCSHSRPKSGKHRVQ